MQRPSTSTPRSQCCQRLRRHHVHAPSPCAPRRTPSCLAASAAAACTSIDLVLPMAGVPATSRRHSPFTPWFSTLCHALIGCGPSSAAIKPLRSSLCNRRFRPGAAQARERFTFVVLDGGTAGQHLQLGAKQRRRECRGGRIKGPASIGIGNAPGLLHGGQGEDR